MSFTSNVFAYFKFHSDLRAIVTGKIKQNQLDSRDTAPLILLLGLAIDIIYFSTLNLFIYLKRRQFYRCLLKIKTKG